MSSVDERIVSMQFNNKQFESGVSTTLNSLDKLKKGLNLSGATKGLEDVSGSAKKINFDPAIKGVEAFKQSFSALEVVGITALANITNSAINAGKNLLSSLTLDPIMDGFREYETQMNAVQTILANTSSKGSTLDDVNAALQELNLYADKTIYNFTEMTKNIGTFTAAGVDLDEATSAIKGIANLAAVSGSNSQQASTAMYQLSQAIASGKVNLQDWNSVVNAGMGGQVFQDALKRTALNMGKTIDATQSFRESISDQSGTGWLTSDVLVETLKEFTGDMSEAELRAKGYTESQIQDIMKMGVTATDAATKVKTFTQLIDTLKEAVGSGWAQTWQTIFGDFEEAKSVFTSASDTLGSFINATSNARNEMLKGWKDLGGRTALIESIKNAFGGLTQILGAVSGAFRDIFPPITSQQLFNFTEGLKNLTANFKLSETNINNLKSTFKGMFAILDIGKTIFLAIANAIGTVLGGTGNLTTSILTLTGSFGEWLVYIDNVIKQSGVLSTVMNTIAKVITMVVDCISAGLNGLYSIFNSAFSFSGFEVFYTFLENMGKRINGIKEDSVSMGTVVAGAFLTLGQAIANSKIGEILQSIWDMVTKIAGAIGKLVSNTVDNISKAFSNASFDGMFDIIGSVSLIAIAKAVSGFMKTLSGSLDDLKSPLDGVKGILDGVRGSFEAYQTNLKSDVLLKIAAAIGIMAASIFTISMIDSEKLVSSLAAIGGLFAQLITATYVFTKIGDFKMKVAKASVVLITMSTSILILSKAMLNLGSLDWNGIAKGMVGITGLATALALTAKVLSQGSGTMMKGLTGLIAFSLAIKILASAVEDLSTISWDGLAKGLIGVSVLLTAVSLFLNNTKFSAKAILTASGIVILSGAIKILASACADFGELSWSSISKGLVSIGALLTELTLFTNLTGNAKNVISTGLALIAISAAMKIMASAVGDFGSMSWESIAKGMVAMGVALTEVAIAVNFMPKNMISTGTGLVIVATALNILSTALISMGSMSWESIAKGLVTLGGSLTILAVGLSAMTGSLPGSAALLVAAGALAVLTPSLMALGAMSWEGIIKSLTMLAGSITIFAGAAVLLTPVIPSMLGLAGAMALLGVSILGIGTGLALAGTGLAALATGFGLLAGVTATGAAAIVTSLGIIITGVIALIPAILEKIGEGIIAFCQVFIDSIPQIVEAITTIIGAIVDCIVTNIPVILNGVLQTLSGILDAIIKWTPSITTKVVEIILALLKVIADNIGKFVEAGVNIVTGFLNGIANSLSSVIDSAFKLVVSFINGLADAIRSNSGAIADACYNLVTAIVDGIWSLNDKFVDAGIYAVKGFIKGLVSMPGKIIEAGKSLGKAALNAAKEALDIHSPSREFYGIGEYSGMGLVNGLMNYTKKVSDAGATIGNAALSSVTNAVSKVSDLISGDLDSTPVITPVMDLSEIQNGVSQLYNMTDKVSSYGIDGSISTNASLARTVGNNDTTTIDASNTNIDPSTPNNPTPKGPAVIQLVLQNGRAIAEYIVDDIDGLMGNKTTIAGRSVGV